MMWHVISCQTIRFENSTTLQHKEINLMTNKGGKYFTILKKYFGIFFLLYLSSAELVNIVHRLNDLKLIV